MEVRNNYSPAFTGICIKTSTMNKAQQALSRTISDMLDYTDEYVKVRDEIDVHFLPGKSKNSVVVKFMDMFSDMFYRKGERTVQTTLTVDGNYSKGVDNIRAKLKGIDEGKYTLPEYDELRFITHDTDLAKIDDDAYAEIVEDIEALTPTVGKSAAEDLAVDSYKKCRNIRKDVEY